MVVEVDRGSGWVDTLILPRGNGSAETLGEWAFDGDFALVREEPSGQMARAAVVGGTRLERRGTLIVDSEQAMGVVELGYEGDKVLMRTSQRLEGLQVNLLGAKEITVTVAPPAVDVTGGIASLGP